MIGKYEKQCVLDVPSQACTVYKVVKDAKTFIMHQFEDQSEADQYSFKVRKRLNMCMNILPIEEDFSADNKKYYISKYMENDLLKDLLKREGHVYDFHTALQLTATLLLTLEQLHEQKLIYRNIRPEKIRLHLQQPYLYDFSMSKFNKRKERVFGLCGAPAYLAPEFLTEDGYGTEVDIWALAVLLHIMLFNQEPFPTATKDIASIKQVLHNRCEKGFKLSTEIDVNSNLLNNKLLADFFRKCFVLEVSERLTIENIKKHRLFDGYFCSEQKEEVLEAIEERRGEQSAIYSHLQSHPAAGQLLREAIIFDFIERSSEALIMDCGEVIPEQVRNRASFAALKVGVQRMSSLLQSLNEDIAPFAIAKEEWEVLKHSSALTHEKARLQKKRKILMMLFRAAARKVGEEKDQFYREEVVVDFALIKIPYRGALMGMFEKTRSCLKAKDNLPQLNRKLVENCVRLIILHLVNRIFQTQSLVQDFALYFKWRPHKNLAFLDQWIETQTVRNLKIFMVNVTNKYL